MKHETMEDRVTALCAVTKAAHKMLLNVDVSDAAALKQITKILRTAAKELAYYDSLKGRWPKDELLDE